VRVYWENAPDYRTSRTLDWLNDACEAKLKANDRDKGVVKYAALMSPASVAFSLSPDWNYLFTQAIPAKLRLGKGKYSRKFPISLLLTTEVSKTGHPEKPRQAQPVLLGTKKWPGRRAAVSRHGRTNIKCRKDKPVAVPSHDRARGTADQFQCLLQITGTDGRAAGDIDIRFTTESEAQLLLDWLKSGTIYGESGPNP
jgi:hypothetical protein